MTQGITKSLSYTITKNLFRYFDKRLTLEIVENIVTKLTHGKLII